MLIPPGAYCIKAISVLSWACLCLDECAYCNKLQFDVSTTSESVNDILKDVISESFECRQNARSRSDKVYRIVRILDDIRSTLETAKKSKRSRVVCASPNTNRLA